MEPLCRTGFLTQCHVPLNSPVSSLGSHPPTVNSADLAQPWQRPAGPVTPAATATLSPMICSLYLLPSVWALVRWKEFSRSSVSHTRAEQVCTIDHCPLNGQDVAKGTESHCLSQVHQRNHSAVLILCMARCPVRHAKSVRRG